MQVARKPLIGLIGFSGFGNFGDELFVRAHNGALGKDFELERVNPSISEPYFPDGISESLERFDGFLLGGGDLLNPIRTSSLYWNEQYLAKPVYSIGLSIQDRGFERKDVVDHYRDFFHHENFRCLNFRDERSLNWSMEKGILVEDTNVFADPVFSLFEQSAAARARLRRHHSNVKQLGIVVRDVPDLRILVDSMDRLLSEAQSKEYEVKLISINTGKILKREKPLLDLLSSRGLSIQFCQTLKGAINAIADCDLLASMRFHAMIVAAAFGVPSISLLPSVKAEEFLQKIERNDLCGNYIGDDFSNRIPWYASSIPTATIGQLISSAQRSYELLHQQMANDLLV